MLTDTVLDEFDLDQNRQSEQDLDHYVESYSRPAELSTSDVLPTLLATAIPNSQPILAGAQRASGLPAIRVTPAIHATIRTNDIQIDGEARPRKILSSSGGNGKIIYSAKGSTIHSKIRNVVEHWIRHEHIFCLL